MEVFFVQELISKVISSDLFTGVSPDELRAMLGCMGYHVKAFLKGEAVALEEEKLYHIGVIVSGAVDMVKEDLWGNRTMLVRMRSGEVFGETFAGGLDTLSVVSFVVPEDTTILFIPFHRIMHTCSRTCGFHHRMVENMVHMIAAKNRELMRKVEVISKKNLREKILAYLSIQAQTQGSRYFEIPLGRVELADYLCADRSALTRELANMRKDKIIDYDRNMFRIL